MLEQLDFAVEELCTPPEYSESSAEHCAPPVLGETVPPPLDTHSAWHTLLQDVILPNRRMAPWRVYYPDVVTFLERYDRESGLSLSLAV